LAADAQEHEMMKHLGMAHMLVETFAIAHNNTYGCPDSEEDGDLRVGLLLAPHFIDLLALNGLAR
jgi:hypothetical protein